MPLQTNIESEQENPAPNVPTFDWIHRAVQSRVDGGGEGGQQTAALTNIDRAGATALNE
jgi:hypothetical protein